MAKMASIALSDELLDAIFGNIGKIDHIHHELLAGLRERQDKAWLSMHVGDLFCHLLVPRLELYRRYSSKLTIALRRLEHAQKDPLFNRVLYQLQSKAGLGWPTLQFLMELPFERIKAYARYLQELLLVSSLELDSEEFYSLSTAACAIQDTEGEMRKDRIETEAVLRSNVLQRLILNGRGPGTPLVKEGPLVNVADRENTWYFFLHTNCVMGAKRTDRGFNPSVTVILDDVSIDQDLGGVSEGASVSGDPLACRQIGHRNGFIVSDGAVTLELIASSPHEKAGWVEAIEVAIRNSKTAQVLNLYSGLQCQLESVIERASLVDERVADEQSITARVATRALDTIDGLAAKVDELQDALGGFEDGEIWPRIVDAFVAEWRPEGGGRSKEEAITNAVDRLLDVKLVALEQDLVSLDEEFMVRVERVVEREAKEKSSLGGEIQSVLADVELQYSDFEREMGLLDVAMDQDLTAQRTSLLNEGDHVQQNLYSLDKKIHSLQVDTEDVEKMNGQLTGEIAERMEELAIMQQRLSQLA